MPKISPVQIEQSSILNETFTFYFVCTWHQHSLQLSAEYRPEIERIALCFVQLKKVLSSIPESVLNVECLMNDIDVSSKMTRELFEEKSQSILDRVKQPLQKVHLTPQG